MKGHEDSTLAARWDLLWEPRHRAQLRYILSNSESFASIHKLLLWRQALAKSVDHPAVEVAVLEQNSAAEDAHA